MDFSLSTVDRLAEEVQLQYAPAIKKWLRLNRSIGLDDVRQEAWLAARNVLTTSYGDDPVDEAWGRLRKSLFCLFSVSLDEVFDSPVSLDDPAEILSAAERVGRCMTLLGAAEPRKKIGLRQQQRHQAKLLGAAQKLLAADELLWPVKKNGGDNE